MVRAVCSPKESGRTAREIGDFEDIMLWGSIRHLTPPPGTIYKVLNVDTSELRRVTGLEKSPSLRHMGQMDLYRFGAKVLAENDYPLNSEELEQKYPDMIISEVYRAIRIQFGSLANFWLEFGRVRIAIGLDENDLVNLGVRWGIQNSGKVINSGHVKKLSKDMRFPSMYPIRKLIGDTPEYREVVRKGLEEYQLLNEELRTLGVSEEVIMSACAKFEVGGKTAERLRNHIDELRILSEHLDDAQYVRLLMKSGLDLLHERTFNWQLEDLKFAIRNIGITDYSARAFVFSLIPRYSIKELGIAA